MEINLKIKYVPVNNIVVNIVNKKSLEELCNLASAKPPMFPSNMPLFWCDGIVFIMFGVPQKSVRMIDDESNGSLFLAEVNFCEMPKFKNRIDKPSRFVDDFFEIQDKSNSYIHSSIAKWLKANFLEPIKVNVSFNLQIETPKRQMDITEAYDIIGATSNDSDETLKLKYQELIKANHPDAGGDTEKTSQIIRAWKMIKANRGL